MCGPGEVLLYGCALCCSHDSCNNYLLGAHCVPDTIPGAWDTVSKTDKNTCPNGINILVGWRQRMNYIAKEYTV